MRQLPEVRSVGAGGKRPVPVIGWRGVPIVLDGLLHESGCGRRVLRVGWYQHRHDPDSVRAAQVRGEHSQAEQVCAGVVGVRSIEQSFKTL